MVPLPRIYAVVWLTLLVLGSCESGGTDPEDFRDRYVGNYLVRETIRSYGFPECGEPYSRERDTVIRVNYGESDTTLFVLGREVWLDSTGSFYDYHYGLRLWNDSIWSTFMNGGLGCGQYETYEGVRISE